MKLKSVTYTQEQIDVINAARTGSNTFFAGYSGTGKSFIIDPISKMLIHDGKKVLAMSYKHTAVSIMSSYLTAAGVNGVTLNTISAQLGLGLNSFDNCEKEDEELFNKLIQNKKFGKKSPLDEMKEFDCVVIDEGATIPYGIFFDVAII